MKFLFANTRYKQIRSEIAERMADRYLSWHEINPLASQEAKEQAIREWAARTANPKEFPGFPQRFTKYIK